RARRVARPRGTRAGAGGRVRTARDRRRRRLVRVPAYSDWPWPAGLARATAEDAGARGVAALTELSGRKRDAGGCGHRLARASAAAGRGADCSTACIEVVATGAGRRGAPRSGQRARDAAGHRERSPAAAARACEEPEGSPAGVPAAARLCLRSVAWRAL